MPIHQSPASSATGARRVPARFFESCVAGILALLAVVTTAPALWAQRSAPTPVKSAQGAEQTMIERREREVIKRVQELEKRAHELFTAGQFDRGRALLEEALALWDWLYPPEKFPAGHPRSAAALMHLGDHLSTGGSFLQALSYHRRAQAMRERLYPKQKFPDGHPEIAVSIGEVGRDLQNLGEFDMAVKNSRRALAMLEQLFPSNRSQDGLRLTAAVLNNLAVALDGLGDHDQAIEVFRRALDVRTRLAASDTSTTVQIDVAHAMTNLATSLARRGDASEGLSFLEKALNISQVCYPEDRFPEGHPDLAAALQHVGALLLNQGKSDRGLPYTQKALAMRERLYPRARFPDGHAALAESLTVLGLTLSAEGHRNAALERIRLALAMRERLHPLTEYPQGHPSVSQCLETLRQLSATREDYAFVLSFQRRKLENAERVFSQDRYPDGHPTLVTCLDELASTLVFLGDWVAVTALYRRSVQISERLYPLDRYPNGHPDLAQSLLDLGTSLEVQYEWTQALEICLRSVGILERIYPRSSYPHGNLTFVTALGRVGDVHMYMKRLDEALAFHRRALEMAEGLFPSERFPLGHPVLVERLERTAMVLGRKGSLDDAMKLLNRAREMIDRLDRRGKSAQENRRLASILSEMGAVHLAKSETDQAVSYCRRAVTLMEQDYPRALFPLGHRNLATALHTLGKTLESRGDLAEAMASYRRALKMRQELASEYICSASEAEALIYTGNRSAIRDCMISLELRLPRRDPELFDVVWDGKACVMRGLKRRHEAILLGSDRAAREIGNQLAGIRLRLAQLPFSGAGPATKIAQELKELTQRKEELERRLASQLHLTGALAAQGARKSSDLARSLPPHSVYIDFVEFHRHQHRAGEVATGTVGYCAFILQPGSHEPDLVDLGAAEPIDQMIVEWRKDIASERSTQASHSLRKRIWEPIESRFPAGTTRVWLAPDGRLSLVPWAALAGRARERVLIEDYSLALVPHGPFLLDQFLAERRSSADPDGLLVVADVDYDQPAAKVAPAAFLAASSPNRGTGGLHWDPLPGTRVEMAAVSRIAGSRPITRLSGTDAGVACTVNELTQARTAHIATHGFFADPRVNPSFRPAASGLVHDVDPTGPEARSPLLFSGLVLAGANRPLMDREIGVPVEDGGILSAEAIQELPLRDLELVVLSACETGLGAVGHSEGVFGLQRAFHLAGARNVVASLWKVDDEATAALMTLFYERLWKQGKSPVQAMRVAQLALYRDPGLAGKLVAARGTPEFDKLVRGTPNFEKVVERPKALPDAAGSSQPPHSPTRQWAAFVLSGDGR
jgi:CHAT domain-containing protein/tetratricopeptide (TPR) repeat protein